MNPPLALVTDAPPLASNATRLDPKRSRGLRTGSPEGPETAKRRRFGPQAASSGSSPAPNPSTRHSAGPEDDTRPRPPSCPTTRARPPSGNVSPMTTDRRQPEETGRTNGPNVGPGTAPDAPPHGRWGDAPFPSTTVPLPEPGAKSAHPTPTPLPHGRYRARRTCNPAPRPAPPDRDYLQTLPKGPNARVGLALSDIPEAGWGVFALRDLNMLECRGLATGSRTPWERRKVCMVR